jgi:hypothetical protein
MLGIDSSPSYTVFDHLKMIHSDLGPLCDVITPTPTGESVTGITPPPPPTFRKLEMEEVGEIESPSKKSIEVPYSHA